MAKKIKESELLVYGAEDEEVAEEIEHLLNQRHYAYHWSGGGRLVVSSEEIGDIVKFLEGIGYEVKRKE